MGVLGGHLTVTVNHPYAPASSSTSATPGEVGHAHPHTDATRDRLFLPPYQGEG